MIPTVPPHIDPDTDSIKNKSIWIRTNKELPLMARWTTDFDCSEVTNWWYCLRDTCFDINSINAKKRYEINKGLKNFNVKIINPKQYVNELLVVTKAAFSSWPEKYRPKLNEKIFKEGINKWNDKVVFAAFVKDTSSLVGYAYTLEHSDYAEFLVLRVIPEYEKKAINAAIVFNILNYYNEKLKRGFYVLDGARSINHETSFQDYLEKYFGFRKAYCVLHIEYNPWFKWLFKLCFLFKPVLRKLDNIGIIHQINSIIKMEEISREKG